MMEKVFLVGLAFTFVYAMPLNMTDCPDSTHKEVHINQVLGRWYLSSIFFHERIDDVQVFEEAACMKANFVKNSSQKFNQLWDIQSPKKNFTMNIDLPTKVESTGRWMMTPPFGVPLHVAVIDVMPTSHMVMIFCAGEDKLMYLWTAVLARKTELDHYDELLSTITTEYDFTSSQFQIPTWQFCLPTLSRK